jgi:hypothetical protein
MCQRNNVGTMLSFKNSFKHKFELISHKTYLNFKSINCISLLAKIEPVTFFCANFADMWDIG